MEKIKPILEKLKEWRNDMARKEGLPLYRIFQNKTLEDIAEIMPKNKEELLDIKGIKERKFEKYGRDILDLIKGGDVIDSSPMAQNGKEEKPYTVSRYLDLINNKLRDCNAKVLGEISSLDIREKYLFFSVKDKEDESLLNCFMWTNDYEICGIQLKEGLEIIIGGFPDIYKPQGRLSFRVSTVELVGEGALKKAYEKLKKKLEDEGLFAIERKKPIPEFVQKIGLITSETGAVIHDFLNNLGKYGYQIKFFNSRVEGQIAVKDLISAINYFQDKDIDVLVIIRGGGSLESLQAFNNEVLVRKIADFKNPVMCGIGHDKDISLASLTADLMVSTPTAVAVALNKSWDEAISSIKIFEKDIIYRYQEALSNKKRKIEILTQELGERSNFIFKRFKNAKNRLMNKLTELGFVLENTKKDLNQSLDLIFTRIKDGLREVKKYLERAEEGLKNINPERQLKLGYSIVSINGKIIKSVKEVSKNEKIDIRVSDGRIKSQVEEIINNK
ncbi:MAG: exodeoxyribonuclease VII large subunit [Parcubacteria group bacterium]|nr:exodeoxyribonuclease VII large subunit [Parcubacteria group bacterium]